MIKILQVIGIIITILGFFGLIFTTDVYNQVQDEIVEVLCLSCLKLDPTTPEEADFTFYTANDEPHPNFILNNLTTGIIFLHYSKDACSGCDIMLPTIQKLFSADYGKQDMFQKQYQFNGSTIHYYYINIDHTSNQLKQTFPIYDKEHIEGLPMFTIITLFYDHGTVRPCYTSLYGTLGPENDTPEKRYDYLTEFLTYSIGLWIENVPGFD